MSKRILRLYPGPIQRVSLKGLYLAHRIHGLGKAGAPFVYANFLSSLDGRIALEDTERGHSFIPKHLTTASDFALFMELLTQADCLITHGGYMRALDEKRLGNILQIEDETLLDWRRRQGLSLQPDVVIASASLAFPMDERLLESGQKIYIATGNNAPPLFVGYWRERGITVLTAGTENWVEGKPLIDRLKVLGYRSIYMVAGPKMLDTVVRDRQLSRFYLTLTHQLLGGRDIRTLLTGDSLGMAGNLELEALFFEPEAPSGSGQFFLQFKPAV
ncbi:MAG: RibD family protein [Gammaproteobacteria bacterium]